MLSQICLEHTSYSEASDAQQHHTRDFVLSFANHVYACTCIWASHGNSNVGRTILKYKLHKKTQACHLVRQGQIAFGVVTRELVVLK